MMEKLHSLIPLHEIEENAYTQIMNVLQLEFLKSLAIMPDVHAGYDLCIGGVALLDNYISPSFVGYDIGCGMTHINTGITSAEVFPTMKEKELMFKRIYQHIPVGFNLRQKSLDYQDFVSASGDAELDKKIAAKLYTSIGTLGGGNHFIEIGENNLNMVCITIHSGSRNIGHSIASKYMKIQSHLELDSDLGQAYLQDMNFALEYALHNRLTMIKDITKLMDVHFDQVKDSLINENHNHAIVTEDGVLHRKGATPAAKDQLGVIPANMRDGVYITKGLGNEEYLGSASHGAGRVYSRKKAKEEIPLDLFQESMEGIVAKVEQSTVDESPFAYKDIDTVIDYQEGVVINVIDKIKPLINVKG